jgi:hypothetical protein
LRPLHPFSTVAGFLLKLFLPRILPKSLPTIPHQWGAAYPHRSAAIFLQVPAITQTPKHPMQTKSPLALMEPRFAVTDQLGRQNSSWVHRARESCARSPIVRLQCVNVFNTNQLIC